MEVDKLNTGEKVAAISAVLLFIFMFFTWFGVEVSGAGGFSGSVPGAGGDAWDALEFIPVILVIAIVAAIGVAVLRLTDSAYEPPISMNAVVTVLGGLSVPADPVPDRRSAELRQLRRRVGRRDGGNRHLPRPDRRRRRYLWRLSRDERGRRHLRRHRRPPLRRRPPRRTAPTTVQPAAPTASAARGAAAPTPTVQPAATSSTDWWFSRWGLDRRPAVLCRSGARTQGGPARGARCCA